MTRKIARMCLTFTLLAISMLLFSAGAFGEEVKGKIKGHSQKGKTLSLSVEGKGVMLFRYTDRTRYVNAQSSRDIGDDDTISVEYATVEGTNVAGAITRVVAKLPEGIAPLSTEELQSLVKIGPEKGNYLLIDSRPTSRYNEGHIPTAISVPFSDLEKEGEKLLPADRSKPLVFYCGGLTCVLSPKSAALVRKLGYTNVRVYAEGEPGWKKAELPLAASLKLVKEGNIVLIDLREPAKVAAGHIPRAVNIPSELLEKSESMLPASKNAPLVFYSDSQDKVLAALETARDWEYRKITFFPGGLDAWQAKGLKAESGPAPTAATWSYKPGPGEVSVAQFEKARKDGTALIVDARTSEEFAAGHFPGAVNVPADEVAKHAESLPKGGRILVHCSTGARAEMVTDTLKARGYKPEFLKAAVEFGKDGSHRITE